MMFCTTMMSYLFIELVFVVFCLELGFTIPEESVCNFVWFYWVCIPNGVGIKDIKLNFKWITMEFSMISFYLFLTVDCFDYFATYF